MLIKLPGWLKGKKNLEFENASSSQAFNIWRVGVDAVRSDRLVTDTLRREGNQLILGDASIDLGQCGKIAVVGGGKGGAQMATAVEEVLGPQIVKEKVIGWVNVPADCLTETQKIHLHNARPAGINEPTLDGVIGSEKMISLVGQLHQNDLCLTLLTGGGSALMPAPRSPITLEQLLDVTRALMTHGATISELNTVRTCLSQIKGGGLARACRAGTLWSLIISDVVGDSLSIIASGPTVLPHSKESKKNDVIEALKILERIGPFPASNQITEFLQQQTTFEDDLIDSPETIINQLIGNNTIALNAAAQHASRLGFKVISLGSKHQGEASEEGRRFAMRCRKIQQEREDGDEKFCILSGGEPVVDLGLNSGKGGRNQQFVLAALTELLTDGMQGITILSGGTDGEDGPTDAAGAVADGNVITRARKNKINPQQFLSRHDAYYFFDACGGLLRTGPTHTNVMDIRVAIIE
jgi:hydroxypyruvate reductase